jgi:hypothetical protein
MDLNLEDRRQIHLARISKGTGYADAVFRHADTSSEFYGGRCLGMVTVGLSNFVTVAAFFFPRHTTARPLHKALPWRCRMPRVIEFGSNGIKSDYWSN